MSKPTSTTSALSLLHAARSFRDAAAGMMNTGGNLDYASQMHAFYLLTGFALEVGMKSHLRHLGLQDSDLTRLRHDLLKTAETLSELIGSDYEVPPNLFGIVGRLGPSHKDLVMRYTPADADLSLPNPVAVMEVIDQLVDGIALRLYLESE